jgi:hypothetical protein
MSKRPPYLEIVLTVLVMAFLGPSLLAALTRGITTSAR